MKNKANIIIIVAIFIFLFLLPRDFPELNKNDSSANPSVILSARQMQEDIDYVIDIIEKNHPICYPYMPKDMQNSIVITKSQIAMSKTAEEFFFIISKLLSSIGDAHTSVPFPFDQRTRGLDISFRWLIDGLYVTKDSDTLLTGDKILSMGNVSVEDLLNYFSKVVSTENEGWTRFLAETYLGFEAFLNHFNLIKDGKVDIVYERGICKKQSSVLLSAVHITPDSNDIKIRVFDDKSLGYFKFDRIPYNEKFNKQVKDFFKLVADKKIENVVLDIRHNLGGSSYAVENIITYLSNVKEYTSYQMFSRLTENTEYLKQFSDNDDTIQLESKKKKVIHQEDINLLFDGNLYILTSNKTFSAGNWLAVLAQDNDFATIIGEPTGNEPSFYGEMLSFTLPNTRFCFTVSLKLFTRPKPTKDPADSLIPDFVIYTTIKDIIEGRDPQMEALFELVETKNKPTERFKLN